LSIAVATASWSTHFLARSANAARHLIAMLIHASLHPMARLAIITTVKSTVRKCCTR
jgi:hypothetical protein